MKSYNKKILMSTKNLRKKTYEKAMRDAHEGTHSSRENAKLGASVSMGLGGIAIVVGLIGRIIADPSKFLLLIFAGIIIILINLRNYMVN